MALTDRSGESSIPILAPTQVHLVSPDPSAAPRTHTPSPPPTCAGGQTERHCGKVGGRSDESAPENDTLGVWAAGQVHGRCYRMHMLDQISTLGAVADSGGGLWGAGSRAT